MKNEIIDIIEKHFPIDCGIGIIYKEDIELPQEKLLEVIEEEVYPNHL